nr:hypothetical protein [Gammaproteobacteria bacterium]
MNGKQFCRVLALVGCVWWLTACTTHQVIHANPAPLRQPATALAPEQRLHVGVALFEPGPFEDAPAAAAGNAPAVIRKAEGRYLAFALRKTLEESGHWGAVRVIPDATDAVDVTVRGRILASNGLELKVSVEARDATGRLYLDKEYERTASKYAYTDASLSHVDPFQDLYNAIANDLSAIRGALTTGEVAAVRTAATLRFAQGVAPYAFEGYLVQDEDGIYEIQRLPAAEYPMMLRILAIHARERDLLRVFDAHYGQLASDLEVAYREWRKSSYEETRAVRGIERSARQDVILGSVAAAGGLAGAASSGNAVGTAASVASVIGGAAVIGRGVKKYSQAEIHRDALMELASSFSQEVAPRVIEVEGRVTTLSGSAEAQFRAWRQLLRELYRTETGLTAGQVPDRQETAPSR